MLFDAHNHLQAEWLRPHLDEVIGAVESLGVAGAVVNGTTEADWEAVAELARRHAWVLPSFGLHPWFLKARTQKPDRSGGSDGSVRSCAHTHPWQDRLEVMVRENPRCAIGEIGLDRWIPDYDLADQLDVFSWQYAFAVERNLPVTIHCLKAWGALWDYVREHPAPATGFLLHAYGGPAGMVDGFVRKGGYFSFSGYFLNANKAERREVFRQIPPERLLVETDAPAMPPSPEHRRFTLPDSPEGKPVNHPANLAAIYEGLAEIRGCSLETLEAQVAENFGRLFRVAAPSSYSQPRSLLKNRSNFRIETSRDSRHTEPLKQTFNPRT